MKSSPLFLSSALLALAGVASADTINVPADFATIQAAVTAAQTGDVIDVRAGYYRENVTVTTAGLTLKGRHVHVPLERMLGLGIESLGDRNIDGHRAA